MTTSFDARVRADVRLAILQILAGDLGYSLNHAMMRDAVDRATAHSLTEEQVKEHFAWLEDRALVKTEELERYQIATLTDRGLKIVQGKERVEGIRLPTPGERIKHL